MLFLMPHSDFNRTTTLTVQKQKMDENVDEGRISKSQFNTGIKRT